MILTPATASRGEHVSRDIPQVTVYKNHLLFNKSAVRVLELDKNIIAFDLHHVDHDSKPSLDIIVRHDGWKVRPNKRFDYQIYCQGLCKPIIDHFKATETVVLKLIKRVDGSAYMAHPVRQN